MRHFIFQKYGPASATSWIALNWQSSICVWTYRHAWQISLFKHWYTMPRPWTRSFGRELMSRSQVVTKLFFIWCTLSSYPWSPHFVQEYWINAEIRILGISNNFEKLLKKSRLNPTCRLCVSEIYKCLFSVVQLEVILEFGTFVFPNSSITS